MLFLLTRKRFATFFTILITAIHSPSAWAGWTATVTGTTASFVGTDDSESISFGVAANGLGLTNDRFAAGDPGFNSPLDFDSTKDGDQTLPDDGSAIINVDGKGGSDSMSILDGTDINQNNILQVTAGSISLGVGPAPKGNRPVFNYSNLEQIFVRTQDPFNGGGSILSTHAGTPVSITGPPDSEYSVGDTTTHRLDNILADVSIENGSDVTIDDASFPDNTTYTVDDSLIRPGIGKILVRVHSEVHIFGGTGQDTWLVENDPLMPGLQLDSGANHDTFIFGRGDGQLDGITLPVSLNAGGASGQDTAIFNDTAVANGNAYLFDKTFNPRFTRNANLIADLGNITKVILNTGPFDDVVTINHTFEPMHCAFELTAGTGGQSDSLFINGTTSFDNIDVFGTSSTVVLDNVERTDFTGFDYLFVNGGDSADNFTASPSPTTQIFLDGEGPDTTPGDTLKLDSGGLPFTLTADTFSVPGYQPVEFSGFEELTEAPVLSVTKTASATGSVGRPLNYSIAVHDLGGDPATSVTLVDTLPDNVTLRSISGALTTAQSGNTLTIDIGDMTNGQSNTVSVVVVPNATGTITNVVSVTANEVQAVTSNTVSSATTNIGPHVPAPDLAGSFQSASLFCRNFGSVTRCWVVATLNEANVGDKFAPASSTRFFLSNDTNLDPSDPSVAVRFVPVLQPGRTIKLQLVALVPANIDPHGKFLIARMDDRNQVNESFEDNNIAVTGPLQ